MVNGYVVRGVNGYVEPGRHGKHVYQDVYDHRFPDLQTRPDQIWANPKEKKGTQNVQQEPEMYNGNSKSSLGTRNVK